jgi:hypothetical protein
MPAITRKRRLIYIKANSFFTFLSLMAIQH